MHTGVILDEPHQTLKEASLRRAELLYSEAVSRTACGEQHIRHVTNQISHAKRVGQPAKRGRKWGPVTPRPEQTSHNRV